MTMAYSLRVSSFNVENLFGRSKVLNFKDPSMGDNELEKIGEFQKLLKNAAYSADDKARILAMYKGDLKRYIVVREDRGKLFQRKGTAIFGVKADGAGDWDGAIEFKRAKFSELTRKNTAKVIDDVRADVACIVEAEDRLTLHSFNKELLKHQFKYSMLIDANDPRGIDVGLYSNYPLGGIKTHMFEKDGKSFLFSRDCLEVEILLPEGPILHMLCNHFKSKSNDSDGSSSKRRAVQARRVAEILQEYDLEKDWVVVAGDFNDTSDSSALEPLLKVENIFDVLALQYPDQPLKRWTYHYQKFEQIDFMLVSRALKDRLQKAGVERRGIFGLQKMTSAYKGSVDVEKEYDTVTRWDNSASDHGAVWAEFLVG